MPPGPEDIAREQIDRMLQQAGWISLEYNPAIPIVTDKGNDFCQKITYKTTGRKPEDLIAEFRTSPMPRIAVTVDMIATGTDIKPLFFERECIYGTN
jgi:type I site-specific restriction endonuclease